MSKLTITEALAELKTIDKRIAKKRDFIHQYLIRQDAMRDPLEREGGSADAIRRERQSVVDLAERKVSLRRAIQKANEDTEITVGGTTRSIADWLVWRRDVAPGMKDFLTTISTGIRATRSEAVRKGLAVVTTADVATKPNDIIVNVDEKSLAAEIESLEEVLGNLDGQLSLKNATVPIEL